MRKRDKHLLRGPQGFWTPASQQRSHPVLGWTCFFVISAHGTLVYVLFSGRSRLKTSENRVLQRLKWRLDITPNDPRVAIQVLARFRRMRLDLQDEVTGKTKASGKRMGWTKCHIYNALCGGLRIFQKKP